MEALLSQCSRDTPPKGEATWKPDQREIMALEAKLGSALPSQLRELGWVTEKEIAQFPPFPSRFRRQYVGIVRNGRKYIYGNFSPKDAFKDIPVNPRDPVMVCDGGPVFFGVEFDIAAQRFTHWGFNGVA